MNRHAAAREVQGTRGTPRVAGLPSLLRETDSAPHVFVGASAGGSAKASLAHKVNALLEESGLSQSAAAQLLGMPQPKVSAIRNYKLRGISLERLMQALLALDQQVEIIVTPQREAGIRSIRVAG